MALHYDLFVIGAGSGGVRAARMAAATGARVGIAEEYRVGGTCVIRGCVPKKLFVYASHFHEEFEDAKGYGHTVGETRFDWPVLIANKDKEIDRLNGIYIRNLEASGVTIHQSRAEFKDSRTVVLTESGEEVTADTFLIATGGAPFKPANVPGIEHAITSNEAFHLETFPKRAIVVGGGYIAVEFAGIFNGLGAETTLIYRGPEILRGFDDDVRALVHTEMAKKGVDVRTSANIARIEKTQTGLVATLEDGSVIEADEIMYATGRKPNTLGLGLHEAGVECDEDGAVLVDAYSKTSADHIYAVGDVTDRVALTPVAIKEGMAFVETRFKANPTAPDHELIPTAVFSQPQVGTVGMSETEARVHCQDAVDIYRSTFRPMKHTLSGRDEKMMMKLIVDQKTDKVLGCHIVGPDAGEIIQAIGIAVKMGATKAQFDQTVAVHPTAAEELVTMREPVASTHKAAAE